MIMTDEQIQKLFEEWSDKEIHTDLLSPDAYVIADIAFLAGFKKAMEIFNE